MIRGQKVILDSDLAAVYGVEVRRLNEQVKRNNTRFPEDFAFRLNAEEWERFHRLRSQNATLKRGRHRKYLPRILDIIDPPRLPEPLKKRIGFGVKDGVAKYTNNSVTMLS